MKVVFASHTAPTGQGLDNAVEFEVTMGGLKSVDVKKAKNKQ
jgi:DNA repair protein RAD57